MNCEWNRTEIIYLYTKFGTKQPLKKQRAVINLFECWITFKLSLVKYLVGNVFFFKSLDPIEDEIWQLNGARRYWAFFLKKKKKKNQL